MMNTDRHNRAALSPDTVPDRLPPHDDRSEAAALGCVLHDASCLDVLTATAHGATDFFYDLRHRTILAALVALREAGNPVSTLTLTTELATAGKLQDAGGIVYVSGLPDATPSAAHLDYCLDKLRTRFVQRRMIQACVQAIAEAYDPAADVAEMVATFRARVTEADKLIEAKEARPARDILRDVVDRLDRLVAGEEIGIKTGFLPIDNEGGLYPGEMVLVCGETGLGKSTLALNLVHRALQQHPVAVISLEMSGQAWMDRLLSLDLTIDRRTFRSRSLLTEGVMRRLAANMPRLGNLPLWICDDGQASVDDIRRIVKHLADRHGVRMVIVDYAQIVHPPHGVISREQQVAYIGRGMRAIAQDTGVVMVLLSQLNDEGKVRESRALLHESHLCLTLTTREDRLWICCSKGRDMQFRDFPVALDALHCRLTQATQMDA